MILKHTSNGLNWVDLESPNQEELRWLKETYNLHPLFLEGMAAPTLRQKADFYENELYAVFHFPSLSLDEVAHNIINDEIDILISDRLLVTAHYKTIQPLYTVFKIFETQGLLRHVHHEAHAGHLFLALMHEMYLSLETQLEHVGDHVRAIESGIFAEEEKKMVKEISKVNHVIINFHRSLNSHEQLLNLFSQAAKKFWGESLEAGMATLVNDYHKVMNVLENYRDVLVDLRETNDSLLSTKINSVMKSLSIMAFITYPLTLIATLFNLQSASNPLYGHPYAFWIILSIMAGVLLIILAFFKRMRWM